MKRISETLPKISKPTGPSETAETRPTPIGGELGRPGSGGSSQELTLQPDHPLTVRAQLPRPVVSYLEWKRHEAEVGMPVRPAQREPTAEEIQEARQVINRITVPLPAEEVVSLLAKIRLMTARRSDDADDQDAQLMLYAEELSYWPADAVKAVLSTQHRHSKWWPTWAELEERLQDHAGTAMRWKREINTLARPA